MTGIYTKEIALSKLYVAPNRNAPANAVEPLPWIDYELTDFDVVCVDTADAVIFGMVRVTDLMKLGKTVAQVTVLDLDAVAKGDIAPEALRQQFSITQRVAIVAALDRADLVAKCRNKRFQRDPERYWKLVTLPCAYAAGFASEVEYANAEKVVRQGGWSLTMILDGGTMTLSAAALLAELTHAEQSAAVNDCLWRGHKTEKEASEAARKKRKLTAKLNKLNNLHNKAASLRSKLRSIEEAVSKVTTALDA